MYWTVEARQDIDFQTSLVYQLRHHGNNNLNLRHHGKKLMVVQHWNRNLIWRKIEELEFGLTFIGSISQNNFKNITILLVLPSYPVSKPLHYTKFVARINSPDVGNHLPHCLFKITLRNGLAKNTISNCSLAPVTTRSDKHKPSFQWL